MRKTGLILFVVTTLLMGISYSYADEPLNNGEPVKSGQSISQEQVKPDIPLSTTTADSSRLIENNQPVVEKPQPVNRPPGDNRPPAEYRPPNDNRPPVEYRPPIDKRPVIENNQTVNPPPRVPPASDVQTPYPVQKERFLNMPQKSQKQVQGNKSLPNEEENVNVKNLQVFPDEYSDLDDMPKIMPKDNDVVMKTLEHARQKYVQAIILVDKGDTVEASDYFEKAIEILNRITSYPGIEQNQNFTDLAKSIMEDYENFVQSIENLNDDSPFFAIRDKLFKQIEINEPSMVSIPSVSPNIKTIELPKDTAVTLIGSKPILAEPKGVVIPLDENEEVLKNIAFLTEEGKKGGKRFFKKWLERTTRWFPMMRRIASEEEMPEELIYLSMIESGLRADAVSHSNAVGLWQFLRTTGQDYQLNIEPSSWIDERRDPEKSTRAAMRFLKDLHNSFNDWHLAIAAYNCGGGRVKRTLRSFGNDSSTYWDIRDKLPKETQHYVPIYIAATKIALNPIAYGFNTDSLKFDEEYLYDTYLLNEPVSLSIIAKCVDTTREVIQQLNPELLRTITPPERGSYTIKIPKNKIQLFVANYSTLSEKDKQPWIEHKVASGESIAKIARDYDVSRNEIASANGLPSYRTKVKAGSILKVPVDKDYFAEKLRREEDKQVQVAISSKIVEDQKAITHSVKSGESLYSIANRYGLRMTDLRNLNSIPYDDDNITIGQKLIVSFSDNNKPTVTANEDVKSNIKFIRHKVKAEETLRAIAENYNVSIDAIKNTNNLHDDKIQQGQMLAIEVPASSGENFGLKTSQGNTVTHEVKADETLGTIAGLYGVTEQNIIKWNPGKVEETTVFAGTLLKIVEPNLSKGSSADIPKAVNKAPKYYTVKRGDTLSSLSRKFGIGIAELQKRNKNLEPDKLRVGQRVRIQ